MKETSYITTLNEANHFNISLNAARPSSEEIREWIEANL
jgi:hypothetical protein